MLSIRSCYNSQHPEQLFILHDRADLLQSSAVIAPRFQIKSHLCLRAAQSFDDDFNVVRHRDLQDVSPTFINGGNWICPGLITRTSQGRSMEHAGLGAAA